VQGLKSLAFKQYFSIQFLQRHNNNKEHNFEGILAIIDGMISRIQLNWVPGS